ncbi:glycosyltransferase [Microbacterium binotii]|uniref:D-inositol 3-phosphate glycosyltransferase n=1 Tax=Microbacterium binotii TaxID=462710 RepID=A0ABN3PJW3_9MICO
MRIAHVVTYISPDGAFGGPVRVALGQAAELASRGHHVTVYAAAPPHLAGTTERDGFTIRTFPSRRVAPGGGFAMMSSPALTRALKRDLPSVDAAHVHLARDLVTIPAALAVRAGNVPYVLQPHGMIDASSRLLSKPLDALATRSLLRDAGTVMVLTDQEASDIAGIEPLASCQPIVNGMKVGELPPYEGREDTVLFLARLHPRKRPVAFVEMAQRVAAEHPNTRFVLVGPDEGEGPAVSAAISASGYSDRIVWRGSVSPDETEQLLARARAYVLPSVNEVFPMTILESLQAGTPVITTDSLGIADACLRYGAAEITDGTPNALAGAVTRVLSSPAVVSRLRAGGLDYLRSELDIRTVADELETAYKGGPRA